MKRGYDAVNADECQECPPFGKYGEAYYSSSHLCRGISMKLKDKKIELLRQVHTRDEMGITTTTLESMGTVWAYFRHLSGKEVFAAATVNYKEEVLFQVNYRTDLTTANAIQYNGRLYNITRIDTFEGYKQDLTLYCTLKK